MTRKTDPIETLGDTPAALKPRKPRKAVNLGQVRIAEVLRVDDDGTADLTGLPPGATILVLSTDPQTSAPAAMKLIKGMAGDHAVIRLVGAASVAEETVVKLVQSALEL